MLSGKNRIMDTILSLPEEDIEKIYNVLLASSKEQAELLKCIFLDDTTYTQETLCDKLFYSPSTVVRHLKKLHNTLKNYIANKKE